MAPWNRLERRLEQSSSVKRCALGRIHLAKLVERERDVRPAHRPAVSRIGWGRGLGRRALSKQRRLQRYLDDQRFHDFPFNNVQKIMMWERTTSGAKKV